MNQNSDTFFQSGIIIDDKWIIIELIGKRTRSALIKALSNTMKISSYILGPETVRKTMSFISTIVSI